MDSRGPIEVALSTDFRSEPYYFSLWDIYTGAQLVVFKGNKGNPISRCLKFIDNNYFITAIDNVVQIWSIFNRKSQDQKLFLPGRPSVLTTSPCGNYLIVGIAEMIYVWHLRSGNLLANTQRHYQTVTVLKMNHDGTFLFSGGEDGTVLVWPFADLISGTHNTGALNLKASSNTTGVNEPRFCWQNHSAPVTDIHITASGLCITTSIDKTVNVYSYSSGARLHCMSDFPTPLWSVAMDRNETRIFLGGQDGSIYQVLTSSLSLSQIYAKRDDHGGALRRPVFTGHKDKVTQLSVSMDGSLLISGSLDSFCKIWDIYQGKLVKDVRHQAPVSNLTTLIVPDAFSLTTITQSQMKPPLNVKPLKRNLYKMPRSSSVMRNDLFEESSTTIIHIKNVTDYSKMFDPPDVPSSNVVSSNSEIAVNTSVTNGVTEDVIREVDDVPSSDNMKGIKSRLKELYLLSAEKIFKDAAHESLQPFKEIADKIVDTNPKKKKGAKQGKLDKEIETSQQANLRQLSTKKKNPNRTNGTPTIPRKVKEAPNTNGTSRKKLKNDPDIFV